MRGLSLCNQATDDVAALADACRHRTYLPNPVLASSLPWVRKRMEQRRKLYALVPEKKRRILIKLLALRSWIGDRVFEKTTAEGMVQLSKGRGREGGGGACMWLDRSVLSVWLCWACNR